eukprot:scaffold682228_cov85-Prasinocladus_malaysianus.AAC.1
MVETCTLIGTDVDNLTDPVVHISLTELRLLCDKRINYDMKVVNLLQLNLSSPLMHGSQHRLSMLVRIA